VIDSRGGGSERPIFDEDDSDLADNQEFDRALSTGTELLSQGNASDARLALEKALRYKPRNQRARNLLGLSLFKLGELPRAEEIYRSLIEDHPADPTLRVNLGLVFLKLNASPDAVRCFETAAAANISTAIRRSGQIFTDMIIRTLTAKFVVSLGASRTLRSSVLPIDRRSNSRVRLSIFSRKIP